MAGRSVEPAVQDRPRAVQGSSQPSRARRGVNPALWPTFREIEPLFQGSETMVAPSELPWTSVSVAWRGIEPDCTRKRRSCQGREVSNTQCEVAVTGRERDVTGRERDVTGSEVAVFWKDLRRMSGDGTTTARRCSAREPAEMVSATRFVDRRSERAGTGSGQLG
jgi:hypothetical protein